MVHESTVYFERCHAAELDDAVALELRSECWERWLRWYSHSQAQTRILYARERLVFLAQGEIADPLPTAESSGDETAAPAPTGSTTEALPRPAEGTAEASQANGADRAATAPEAVARRRNPRRAGSEVCEPVCRPRWDRCVDRCVDAERTCIAACQSEYGNCMSGCI